METEIIIFYFQIRIRYKNYFGWMDLNILNITLYNFIAIGVLEIEYYKVLDQFLLN